MADIGLYAYANIHVRSPIKGQPSLDILLLFGIQIHNIPRN